MAPNRFDAPAEALRKLCGSYAEGQSGRDHGWTSHCRNSYDAFAALHRGVKLICHCFKAFYVPMLRACVQLDDLLRAIKP